MAFGSVLQMLRKQWELSQRNLADRVGVNFTYISKIENEVESPPSEETLIKMAEVFGVDKYAFIISAGKMPTDFHNLIMNDDDVQKYLKDKMKEEK
jgi:transcriptional regulator with XRE-family HTH domain